MTKTLKVDDDTHADLVRIQGELQSADGKTKTLDDTIKALIQKWRKVKS